MQPRVIFDPLYKFLPHDTTFNMQYFLTDNPTKIFFLFYILFEMQKSLTSCKNKIKAVCCRLIHFGVTNANYSGLQFQHKNQYALFCRKKV